MTGNHTNSKGDGKLTVYYGGIAGEHGNLEGCVFNDGLDTEDTVIPGDAGNGEDSNSVKTVDTGDNFPFAWLSLILILAAAAGAGAVFARRS